MTVTDLLEADALRSYEVFARHRNFTRAAAELHLSQPSLHVKIRKLAAALGVELYERQGRELVLTEAGRRLARYAQDARRRREDFLVEFAQDRRTLTVAAGRSTFRWVIDHAIRRLAASRRELRVVTADRDTALSAVDSGDVDLAVIAYDPPPERLESVQIARYPQVVAVPRDHALAQRSGVRVPDLDGLELVVPPEGRPHRRALERALLDAGINWRASAEADGWDLLVHFAASGFGATIVNGCVALPDELVAVPVTDLPAVRYWAVWRAPRHAHVAEFLDHLGQP